MIRSLLERLPGLSRGGERSRLVSVLLPILIIAAGLGVLAWRSYELSVRMERGANLLAVQYAGYAAEMTARRVDTAVRSELSRVVDEWQQVERYTESPTAAALHEWVENNEWIISAIYVPDHDPASSVYASELAPERAHTNRLSREFFTSTGSLRYTYDADLLLARVQGAIRQQPLSKAEATGGLPIRQSADVRLVHAPSVKGLVKLSDGFAHLSPLGPPLSSYAVRAIVPTAYVGSGWANQRVVSLLLSLAAILLMALGVFLAVRGLTKEAETTRLRSALIANVSHELRTPLSMIRLGAETLKRGAALKEKDRRELEDQILREVLHLSHLVENVLDVARIQHNSSKAVALTPVVPSELVRALIADYESWIRSKGFSVKVQMEEGIEAQMWDREAVARALLNLIDNAIKYSSEEREIVVALRPTDEHIALEVRDRGLGIAAKDVGRIFDPYFRAQFSDTQTRRGAGLGLTLVKQIAEAHGGKVEVESELGVGSTFRILIPRTTPEERLALGGLVGQTKPLPS